MENARRKIGLNFISPAKDTPAATILSKYDTIL
jgi:hypothetical protein